MSIFLKLLIFSLSTCAVFAQPGLPFENQETTEILVIWKDTTNMEQQRQQLGPLNAQYGLQRSQRARIKSKRNLESFILNNVDNSQSVINDYMETGLFEIVEKSPVFSLHQNGNISISKTPNDPLFPDQWYFGESAMNMDSTWFITTGADSIVIAIIDAGFTTDHPEISSRLWVNPNADNETSGFIGDIHGWNFIENNHNLDADPNSNWSYADHGALVSSALGALGNNGEGFAGASWENPIMLLRIWDDTGASTGLAFIESIEYAVQNGAKVINMSFGSETNSQIIENTLNDAHNAGVMLFASSGNFGDSTVYYPAGYNNVFAIGAYDQSLKRAPFSNYGSHIDFLAPGTSIYATNNKDYSQYLKVSGTSFSSPLAGAAAGLILSINPNITRDELREILILGAVDEVGDPQEDTQGFDRYHGWGNINVYKSVKHTKKTYNNPPEIKNTIKDLDINTLDSSNIDIYTSSADDDSIYIEMAYESDIFTLNKNTLKRTNFDLWGNHSVEIIAHDIWDTTRVNFSFLINSPPFFTSLLSIEEQGYAFDTITTAFSIADSNDALPDVLFSGVIPVDFHLVNDTVFAKWVFEDTGSFVSNVVLKDSLNTYSFDTLQISFKVLEEIYTHITKSDISTNKNSYSVYLSPNPFSGSGYIVANSIEDGNYKLIIKTLQGNRAFEDEVHFKKGKNIVPIDISFDNNQIVIVKLFKNSQIVHKNFFYLGR